MIFEIRYSDRARKQIKKLDRPTQALIKGWIDKNLVGTTNPRQHGKALTANRSSQWRYRVADYRILAEILNQQVIILVLEIGHRRDLLSV